MPKAKISEDSLKEPLELLYRNGEAVSSSQHPAPRYSDICLIKNSKEICDTVIEVAENVDHPIHSEQECQDCIYVHRKVDETLSSVRKLAKEDREGFVTVLAQIAAAIEPVQVKLISLSQMLRERITKWREMVLEGERKEQERLVALAVEKAQEAKYTPDPQKRRQAAVQAKQLEKAAKAAEPKPAREFATEKYWVLSIKNRTLAAKLPDELVPMDVNQQEGNRRLRAMEQAGEKISPNTFPGLTIEEKTRVRIH